MTEKHKPFDTLVWKYLDQEMTDEEFAEFEMRLSTDPECRKRYHYLISVHESIDSIAQPAAPLNLSSKDDTNSKRSLAPLLNFTLGAAACLLLVFFLSGLNDKSSKVILLAEQDTRWSGYEVEVGEIVDFRMMHLLQGAIALELPGNTKAMIEGPASFQVLDNQTIELSLGTITAEHNGAPGSFKVLTPLGLFTDLGTEFGVSVGKGTLSSIVTAEVYDGEIVLETKSSTDHLLKGESLALVGDNVNIQMSDTLSGKPIKVRQRFELSADSNELNSSINLALGKPVTASSYYNNSRNGETFLPNAVTDGRLADSGSPGDWSFWLAANHQPGEFTVDLESIETISRIDLQNTRNRWHNDRGTDTFEIETSLDGESFAPLIQGTLQPIASNAPSAYIFESFDFPARNARYIRYIITKHIPDPTPNLGHHGSSGGLNEIRIY